MEKKIPTPELLQEYRELLNSASTDADYEKAKAFEDEYETFAQIFEEDGKKGVKDIVGEIIVPALFDEIAYTFTEAFSWFAIPVVNDGKYGLVKPDGSGEMLEECIYDNIVLDDWFYFLLKDGKQGLCTATGKRIIPAEMDKVYHPFNDLVTFEKEGKEGYAMMNTGIITEAVYDSSDILDDEYLSVTYNGQSGYIDADGQFTTDEDEAFFNVQP